jgi:hypothetical protein
MKCASGQSFGTGMVEQYGLANVHDNISTEISFRASKL